MLVISWTVSIVVLCSATNNQMSAGHIGGSVAMLPYEHVYYSGDEI